MGDIFGGDYSGRYPQETTGEALSALIKYLPDLSKVYGENILPVEQARLASSQAVSPGYAGLQTQLYGQYGPEINRIGSEIARQNALASAGTDLAVLQGPGRQLIQAGVDAQKLADPEYYAARAAAGNQVQNLLNSIDVNKLSGSERAETERYINQQNQGRGSPDVQSNINTVKNAVTFGSALQNKRNALAQAISAASQFLPSAKSGVDVFQQATGKPSIANTGEQRLGGVTQPSGDTANLTNNLLGNIFQNQRQFEDIRAGARPAVDFVNQSVQAFGSAFGSGAGGCCFIFLEAYNGVLPWWIRGLRDRYYQRDPAVAIGYKRMSKILVPLMERSKLIKELVNYFMIVPLTQFGGWLVGEPGFEEGKYKLKYKTFWFKVWKFLGKF